eukprot:3626217-Pleurochrysis_carterae.AAC.2
MALTRSCHSKVSHADFVSHRIGGSVSCRFDVDSFSSVPPQCQQLSGLLTLFRAKVGGNVASGAREDGAEGEFSRAFEQAPLDVSVSARHTFSLADFPRWERPVLAEQLGPALQVSAQR